MSRAASRRRAGTTLIELVVTLTISAVLSGVISNFIARPMQAYEAVDRRAALADAAETALRRIARDVRGALPNSLRVAAGGTTLELLATRDGARYRADPGVNPSTTDHTADSDWLSFTGDDSFNVIGRFSNLGVGYGTALAAGTRLAIYSTNDDVYTDAAGNLEPGVITPSTTTITVTDDGDEDQISLSSAFDFRFESPRQRLFVVESPLTYRCDLGAGTLTRYRAYAISASQPTNPGSAPLSGATAALVAEGVTGCAFTYTAGTMSRAALLTLELSLSERGESVTLLHEVHVSNLP